MGRYAVVLDPLQIDVAPRDLQPIPEGATLADLLPHGIVDRERFICSIIGPDFPQGAYIRRQHWSRAPKPGHVVVFHRPVLGGGDGSNPLRIVLMIAAIAILGPGIPALGIPGVGLTGVGLAVGTIAASLLINGLIPLDQGNLPTVSSKQSPTFSAAGNQARLDDPIPELFGHVAVFPDFAAPPYSVFDDKGDQYYHCVMLVSSGQLRILQVYIDDTPISDFDNVVICRIGPGQTMMAGPGQGYETFYDTDTVSDLPPSIWLYEHANFLGSSVHLTADTTDLAPLGFNDKTSSVWVERGTWSLYVDSGYGGESVTLGPGMYATVDLNDKFSSARLTVIGELIEDNIITAMEVTGMEMPSLRYIGPFIPIKADYRASRIYIDIVLPRGLDDGRSITWEVQVRPVNDFGQPIGAWAVISTETYSAASVTPVRRSYAYTLATPIRPQVRLIRKDERTDDEGAAHDITWGALRVKLDERGILYDGHYDGATYVAIRIKASEQLSGFTQSRFRVLAERLLPQHNGSAWTGVTVTRNPAWAMTHVLRSRGMPDEQIDVEQFRALATIWDQRNDSFDMVFDDRQTMWDALAIIAKVGRAVPLIRGSRVTCWRDQQESAPVAAFTMRDIREGSFELEFALAESDPVDAIDLEYHDHRRWDWVTVTAQYANGRIYGYRGIDEREALGLDAPSGPLRVRVPGIIGEHHAIRTAVFHLADLIYRPNRANISTELQGLLPAYGSLVALQHDVGDFGQAGDVVAFDADTLILETSEPLRWTTGAKHYVRLARPNGTLTDRIRVTQAQPMPHAMLLTDEPDFDVALYAASAEMERPRYVFGPAANTGALAKLKSITPRSEREIDVTLVLEDDRVHTADNAWLLPDPVSDGAAVSGPGGGDDQTDDMLVYLTAHVMTMSASGPMYGKGTIEFRSDGRLILSIPGAPDDSSPYEWINPQTITSTLAGLYEVYVSIPPAYDHAPDLLDSFPSGRTGSDGINTWLSLGTTRSWTIYPGMGSVPVEVQIRIAATGVVQAAKTITVIGWVPPEGA